MTIVDKIEEKAVKYVESGLECPDFVYLSPNMYRNLLKELPTHQVTPSSGHNSLAIYTSAAYLRVRVCSSWPNDSIIIGDHPIITFLEKLGDII